MLVDAELPLTFRVTFRMTPVEPLKAVTFDPVGPCLLGLYSQEPIDCDDESDVISRKSDRGQYDHHGNQARLRDASGADAGRRRGDASQSGDRNQ